MQSWKQCAPPGCHHNGFVATHALGIAGTNKPKSAQQAKLGA